MPLSFGGLMEIGYSRIATATANNAAATVTIAAPTAGQAIYIIGIHASFTTALTTAKLMTLTDGTTTFGNWNVFSTLDPQLGAPVKMAPNAQAVISLPASGAVGNVGAVTVEYYIG